MQYQANYHKLGQFFIKSLKEFYKKIIYIYKSYKFKARAMRYSYLYVFFALWIMYIYLGYFQKKVYEKYTFLEKSVITQKLS